MADERLPVTLLAGFLGSGKTTLLNRILASEHGLRLAVVVNEFGDVGIDGRLVVGGDEELVELANGCLCCTMREDLRLTLVELLARRRRRLIGRAHFDRVVIEASGLASPGPAVQTLLVDGELAAGYRPAGVVTLAHAEHVVRQLTDHPEAAEQVAYADQVLLNHADRVGSEELAAAREALVAVNVRAPVVSCVRAEVDVASLFELEPFEDAAVLCGSSYPRPEHSSGVGSITLRATAPLDADALRIWLEFLARRRGMELMRAKGVLRVAGAARERLIQGVYQWIELSEGEGEPPEESLLVLIGRDLDREEVERGWRAVQR